MALLVGKRLHRNAPGFSQKLPCVFPHQKAGHVGALFPGGGNGDPQHCRRLRELLQKGTQHLGQLAHMVEHGIALPQPFFPLLHREKFFAIAENLRPVKQGGGGGVIAGVDPHAALTHGRVPAFPAKSPWLQRPARR